ncbi:MAG: FKBP-type peptidyl-prolyl cis-trans isomerase [Halothiobacillaceae bacterium]|nr:FKBP-type peptidyl-prolyl cis-trans isomerase [Halothiobacillaceae bacterium]
MNKIFPGCRVKLAFVLSLLDGTEIDSATTEEPMELLVGDGSISPGLEFAFQGMRAGESGRFDIPPGIAFPVPDEDKVFVLPPEDFSSEIVPEIGQFIEFELPNGETTAARVLRIDDDGMELDFNHPLAGLPLVFEVHVLDVQC